MTTETLKNPSVPVPLNPYGIDKAIYENQLLLAELTWLEKSFGRAWSLPTTVHGNKRMEPMVYQGTSEYYSVLPNDALKSYSFWRVPSVRGVTEHESGMAMGSFLFSDAVDLIVWFDMRAIDPTKNYIFKEELIRDVLNKLDKSPTVRIKSVWDDKVEDIFRGYTLFEGHRDLLMYPYGAFRIETQLEYQFDCLS